jgi:phosphonoacetaldehyde hydrolase
MEFVFRRSYRGRLKAVILDWAGTTVDHGSFAPTAVFMKLFETRGVPITMAEARAPMGLMKKDHLRAIAAMPAVAARWQQAHNRPCDDGDIDRMFEEFVPMQKACLTDYADPIPGALTAVAQLRGMGLLIGSTTGYTREMMEVLVPEAERRGYSPDTWVCPSDAPAGRPHPWMCLLNAMHLGVYPMEAMVKVGDTVPDIEEGLNAGVWTVGLAVTGNGLGMTAAEVEALPLDELEARRHAVAIQLYQAGAHYVVDGIRDCPALIEAINARLAQGERP